MRIPDLSGMLHGDDDREPIDVTDFDFSKLDDLKKILLEGDLKNPELNRLVSVRLTVPARTLLAFSLYSTTVDMDADAFLRDVMDFFVMMTVRAESLETSLPDSYHSMNAVFLKDIIPKLAEASRKKLAGIPPEKAN